MQSQRHIWAHWAGQLHKLGLGGFAAAVLEAAAPLNLLGAQIVYLGQPLLQGLVSEERLSALASLLEDERQMASFLADLHSGEV